jgi:hypothetical protein
MTKKVNLLLLLILATGFPIALGLFFPGRSRAVYNHIVVSAAGRAFVAAIVVDINRENYTAAKRAASSSH